MFYNDPNFVNPFYTGSTGATGDVGATGGFYGSAFYGTDELGYGWGGPINTNAYQNNPNTVVLYWSFKPYLAAIHDMTWEIQTDLVSTFDSADLITYTTHTNGIPKDDFISGCVHKGYSVPIYPRAEGSDKTMYWRVRGYYGNEPSRWSNSTFVIPGAIDKAARDFTLSFLPDVLYNKSEGSNIYTLHNACAQEFEELNKTITLVNNDLYTISVRDVKINSNFGELVDIQKPYEMKVIDYREIIKNFMSNIRSAPSEKSVSAFLHFVYGSYPEFINVEDISTMYLEDTNPDSPVPAFYSFDHGDDAPIIWDGRHIAYGVVLDIHCKWVGQPYDDIITKQFVLTIIRKMSQAHSPVYLNYVA